MSDLGARAAVAFAADLVRPPRTSLRGGDALDGYREAPSFDPRLDATDDAYLERYAGGLTFLDPASWRHYLPALIDYALRRYRDGSEVIEALLWNLRPPDRDPPRLASLTPEQEGIVRELLELLAFAPESAHQTLACQVLEEWWIPGALYR